MCHLRLSRRRPEVLAALLLAPVMLATLAGPARAGDALEVHPQVIVDRKAVFATVESVDVLAARARLGGTVHDLAVDEGDAVGDGQRLALVVDDKMAPRIQALEARLEAQAATVSQARTDLTRAERLRAQGAAPQSRLDEARTALEVAERQRDSLASDLEVLRQQVSEGAVRAPGEGRVLDVLVSDGSVVLPGEAIARVATERYLLRLRLPERHARFIGVGDAVRVGPRGLDPSGPRGPAADGDGWRDGRVVKVYPELDQGRVIADVAVDGLGGYFVGERARVDIVTGERMAYVVPPAYLTTRHGVTAVCLEGRRVAVVQTGAWVGEGDAGRTGGGIEVLSGLRPGDVLVPVRCGAIPAAGAPAGHGE
ncbi:efflux RND transporter periplasmic adaptor subunit [Roseospira visakhapatnamensis]|uniref:RND family efflux transporter MFP subunit n=1 Tax=Roseospira visakhapatnamensis TaxID=390880 RepID=A0A7W6RB19_9PROT|nr:HlyD family efflux transporter periplasmic adaptor subunit [Roseospira visakhapatnamensis]MBB4264629.1 RND family efflux transporter MFP subunit [Roseospira visakhapatnamensis]